MFGHPLFALSVARERHQALIAEADHRRLLSVVRQARKERKRSSKRAGHARVQTAGVSIPGRRPSSRTVEKCFDVR